MMVMSRSNNTSDVGIPPYYLIAFSPGEIPTTSLMGSDPVHLSWTVNHPCGKFFTIVTVMKLRLRDILGSSLLLTVVDSQGVSGGVSGGPNNPLYSVKGTYGLCCNNRMDFEFISLR